MEHLLIPFASHDLQKNIVWSFLEFLEIWFQNTVFTTEPATWSNNKVNENQDSPSTRTLSAKFYQN